MAYTATDREQIEELKKWWNDYGKAIALAVIVGLFIGFAWRYWHTYMAAKEMAASEIYQSMEQAAVAQQSGVVAQDAAQLQDQYGRTVYATLGNFLQARIAISQGRYSDAHAALGWVIHHAPTAPFQQVARIRDARVLLQINQPDQARQVLASLNDVAYQPMIDEMIGDIDASQGNTKDAFAAFQRARTAYDFAGISHPLLDLKMAN